MRPSRMNMQKFKVRRLVRDQDLDEQNREPTGDTVYEGVDGDPDTWELFYAQPKYFKFEEKVKRSLGGLPATEGHISYRSILAGGVPVNRLRDGDLIVQRYERNEGWVACNWKVFGAAEPFAHTKGGENCFMSHFMTNDNVTTDTPA